MTRINLPIGRRLFVAVAALALLAVTLPARLVAGWLDLDAQGISARAIEGPVLAARASEVRAAGMPIGDVAFGLHPLPLLTGRARIGFSGAAAGTITVSRHATELVADRLTLPAGGRFAPLPVTTIAFEGLRVRFRDGSCEQAEGLSRITLAGDPALGLPGSLSGNVRCEAGALAMPLEGAGARASLQLRGDRLHAELSLSPADPAAGARLAGAGFVPAGGAYAMAFDAVW